jgi:hypothetical protein
MREAVFLGKIFAPAALSKGETRSSGQVMIDADLGNLLRRRCDERRIFEAKPRQLIGINAENI